MLVIANVLLIVEIILFAFVYWVPTVLIAIVTAFFLYTLAIVVYIYYYSKLSKTDRMYVEEFLWLLWQEYASSGKPFGRPGKKKKGPPAYYGEAPPLYETGRSDYGYYPFVNEQTTPEGGPYCQEN